MTEVAAVALVLALIAAVGVGLTALIPAYLNYRRLNASQKAQVPDWVEETAALTIYWKFGSTSPASLPDFKFDKIAASVSKAFTSASVPYHLSVPN